MSASGPVVRIAALASLTATFATAPATTARFTPPHWLLNAEHTLLQRGFENARPIHVHYTSYPKKIAVVFEFDHLVVCGICSGPSNAAVPRGKVVRVSFNRRTHELDGASDGWAMQFCDSVGSQPPKRNCLHR